MPACVAAVRSIVAVESRRNVSRSKSLQPRDANHAPNTGEFPAANSFACHVLRVISLGMPVIPTQRFALGIKVISKAC